MKDTITVEAFDNAQLKYVQIAKTKGTVRLRFANGMLLDVAAQLDDAVGLHAERSFILQPVATNHVCLKWNPRP